MTIEETMCASVRAVKLWNDLGIDVLSNQTYNFVVPENESWVDWHIRCGADRYVSSAFIRPWEGLRRVPDANWFKLIGTVGEFAKPPIVVGSKLIDFSPPFPGRLYFFANDLLWNWNNKGCISVRVMRTRLACV